MLEATSIHLPVRRSGWREQMFTMRDFWASTRGAPVRVNSKACAGAVVAWIAVQRAMKGRTGFAKREGLQKWRRRGRNPAVRAPLSRTWQLGEHLS
jgi:hypothetical protein